jgi:hypothetical protein
MAVYGRRLRAPSQRREAVAGNVRQTPDLDLIKQAEQERETNTTGRAAR